MEVLVESPVLREQGYIPQQNHPDKDSDRDCTLWKHPGTGREALSTSRHISYDCDPGFFLYVAANFNRE